MHATTTRSTRYPTCHERELVQAREAYDNLCTLYPNADALYEDTIINAITGRGLYLLRKYHLIETCACFDGRRLYAI